MANTTSPANPEIWSSLLEQGLRKSTIFREFCSFKEEKGLSYGDVINRPHSSDISVDAYVAGTASTAQDITITANQLTINKFNIINVYIDDTEEIQSKYALMAHYVDKMRKALAEDHDIHALLEIKNAVSDVDDNDMAVGTSGDPFLVTESNINAVFTTAGRKLNENNATDGKRFAVITPLVYQKLLTYVGGKDTVFGDKVTQFGYPSKGSFNDFTVYMSNQLPYSNFWTPINNPTDGATLTIDSVVFTFVDTIGVTAGNVHIGSATSDTLDNLVGLINSGGVTTDSGVSNVSLSTANKRKVRQWLAVDGATIMTVYVGGKSANVVVATSEALDLWDTGTIHQFFGEVGCVDMVVQKGINVKMSDQVANGKLGTTNLVNSMFGVKTFYEGTYRMVDVKVSSSST